MPVSDGFKINSPAIGIYNYVLNNFRLPIASCNLKAAEAIPLQYFHVGNIVYGLHFVLIIIGNFPVIPLLRVILIDLQAVCRVVVLYYFALIFFVIKGNDIHGIIKCNAVVFAFNPLI